MIPISRKAGSHFSLLLSGFVRMSELGEISQHRPNENVSFGIAQKSKISSTSGVLSICLKDGDLPLSKIRVVA